MIGPSVQVPLNGTTHTLPARRAIRWGNEVTSWFQDLSDVIDGTFQEITVAGAATSIDFEAGKNAVITLNASTTFTFTNPRHGRPSTIFIYYGGAFTPTFPSAFRWTNGGAANTAPAFTATSGRFDTIAFMWIPSKSQYAANVSLNHTA